MVKSRPSVVETVYTVGVHVTCPRLTVHVCCFIVIRYSVELRPLAVSAPGLREVEVPLGANL